MKIEGLRINGLKNPVGFAFERVSVSWHISEEKAEPQEAGLKGSDQNAGEGNAAKNVPQKTVPSGTQIRVARDAGFKDVVWEKVEKNPDPRGTVLDLNLDPMTRYYVKVVATMDNGETVRTKENYYFETGKRQDPWVGKWIGMQEGDTYHPEFTKCFDLTRRPERARIYISGLGMYVAYLNGKRIGDEILTPYYSDYHREVQYQTFDLTDLLEEHNEIRIVLGDGWYKGAFGLQNNTCNWGSDYKTIAEIHVAYPDGTEDVIGTDETWTYHGSDITVSGIYDGESVDHTLWDGKENPEKPAVLTSAEGKLVERYSMPVTERDVMPVQKVISTPSGETVLDFGQNFAGYVSFYNRTGRGTRILFDTAEILQDGEFYNENYRSARSQFEYISDGKEGWVTPDFTYFGFRYIRVKAWDPSGEPLTMVLSGLHMEKEDFVGKAVYSSLERTGWIETGNAKVNRLYENALWGQKSNFVDIPTDCPQRDERLGWCGDAQVFSGTASYNMNTAAFYNKFLHDIRSSQLQLDGIVPGVLPVFDPKAAIYSSVWGDIGTILPTVVYEHYGDTAALEQYYPIMKDWVDRITADDSKRGQKYLFDWGAQLGDWLALDGRTQQSMSGGTDEYFIGSCYYAMSAQMTAQAARALGKASEEVYYMNLHDHIRDAILKEYFTDSGRLSIDTQTGYIVSLYTGIYKDKQRIIDGLKKRLYKDCYKIKGGFVGAPIMCRVMADNGMIPEAYYFLLQEGYPGWLHCVDLGATTIWERWNSVLDNGKLSGTMMNSLNHYAFGAVAEFLYRNAGGLSAVEPGFHKVRIAPEPDVRLGYLKLRYASVYGDYRVEWKINEDGMLHVEVEIPVGCSAQVVLPYSDGQKDGNYSAGTYVFDYQPTKNLISRYTETTIFKDMMQDPEAMEIIAKDSPLLQFFLDQEDYQYETLSTLGNMFFMGFTPEMIALLKKDLLALPYRMK